MVNMIKYLKVHAWRKYTYICTASFINALVNIYMQVPLMLKAGLLSGNCVQVTYKLSGNIHWWKLVPKEKMQLRVSSQFQPGHFACCPRQVALLHM